MSCTFKVNELPYILNYYKIFTLCAHVFQFGEQGMAQW